MVLQEGSVDFLAELVTGPHLACTRLHQYARAHERVIWDAFLEDAALQQKQTADREISFASYRHYWFHSRRLVESPPNLGQWVGYRIAQAYYARVATGTLAQRRAAVKELVELHDPKRILRESGYTGR
jgi:hypothetical protein